MTKESVGKLKLGLGLNDLITILGEPVEKSKDELWEADGEYHQTYMYPNLGIQLDMIGENEADKAVNMVTITGPCDYKTNKGISIGSRYDEVKAAYKDYLNPYFSNRESIVAGSIYGGVVFGIEKDRVKSIFIGARAE